MDKIKIKILYFIDRWNQLNDGKTITFYNQNYTGRKNDLIINISDIEENMPFLSRYYFRDIEYSISEVREDTFEMLKYMNNYNSAPFSHYNLQSYDIIIFIPTTSVLTEKNEYKYIITPTVQQICNSSVQGMINIVIASLVRDKHIFIYHKEGLFNILNASTDNGIRAGFFTNYQKVTIYKINNKYENIDNFIVENYKTKLSMIA